MELRQLKYLLSIAEEGTFTAAAEKLHISQSALSQQVKKVETELSVPLFDRSRNRLQFTQAGQLLHQGAKQIIKEVDEVKKAIDELEQLYRGTLTIGVLQTVNAYLIPKIVSDFSSQFPDVSLKVQELAAPQVEQKVYDGEIDAGISFHPTEHKNLSFSRLFKEELVLIVNPEHPLARRANIDIKDLNQRKLILLPKDYCTRRVWEDCAKEAQISFMVQIEMNTIGGLLSTLQYSNSAGTVLPALTMQMKAADSLKAVKLKNPSPQRTVGFLWRNGGYKSVASRKFAEVAEKVQTRLEA